MTDQAQQLETIDPYNVPETLCIGRFNIAITGAFATLTFTHERPDPTALLAEGRIDVKAIVRARIVTTVDNLARAARPFGQPDSILGNSRSRHWRFCTSIDISC